MKTKVLLMASLAMLGASQLKAQLNVGANTAPASMLYVNGPTATASTTVTVSGNSATINVAPLTGSGLVLLNGTATATISLIGSGTPVAGQHITINNTTTFDAAFGSATVQAGKALSLVYSNGAWQATAPLVTNIYTNDGTLSAARTVTQGANTLTFSGTGTVSKLSGAAGSAAQFTLGRTTFESDMGVASVAAQAFAGTVAGDGWVRSLTGNMHIGTYAANDMVFYSSNAERMRLSGAGYMGIGTSAPFAPLQFASITANKKLVLYDQGLNAGNDSNFYGFGVSAGTLRYQVPSGQVHQFFNNKTSLLYLGASGDVYSQGPAIGNLSGYYMTDRSRVSRQNAIYSINGTLNIWGSQNGDLLSVDTIGTLTLPKYGLGNFTGTAVNYLAVDAAGKVIEQTLSSGTAPNIYNVDGKISSARIVDMNSYTMGFKGTAGTFTFNNTGNTFGTNATSLTLTQIGDAYGSSSMKLLNRFGQNGLLITTGDLNTGSSNVGVADIFMQTQGGGTGNIKQKQMNMRVESRSGGIYGHYQNSIDTTEMQFFNIANFGGNGPAMVIGDQSVVVRQSLGIAMSTNDSVRTQLAISPFSQGAKITLYDGGSLTTHFGFGVSTSQLNYDVPANTAHVFYVASKNGTGTEELRINNIGTHIPGSKILEFGSGLTKQGDAGKMGYGLFTTDALDILGGGTSTRTIKLWDNVVVPGTVTAGGSVLTSDRRLKKNIVILNGALGKVMQLQAYSYDKKSSLSATKYDQKEMGFIAQDLRKVFPELVVEGTDKDKLLAVNYTALIPLLTKAIQEQQAQNDVQVAQIANLKKENAIITAQLAQVSEMKTAMAEMRKELNKMAVIKVAGSNTASK